VKAEELSGHSSFIYPLKNHLNGFSLDMPRVVSIYPRFRLFSPEGVQSGIAGFINAVKKLVNQFGPFHKAQTKRFLKYYLR